MSRVLKSARARAKTKVYRKSKKGGRNSGMATGTNRNAMTSEEEKLVVVIGGGIGSDEERVGEIEYFVIKISIFSIHHLAGSRFS